MGRFVFASSFPCAERAPETENNISPTVENVTKAITAQNVQILAANVINCQADRQDD
jgi:hypothetical protein